MSDIQCNFSFLSIPMEYIPNLIIDSMTFKIKFYSHFTIRCRLLNKRALKIEFNISLRRATSTTTEKLCHRVVWRAMTFMLMQLDRKRLLKCYLNYFLILWASHTGVEDELFTVDSFSKSFCCIFNELNEEKFYLILADCFYVQ